MQKKTDISFKMQQTGSLYLNQSTFNDFLNILISMCLGIKLVMEIQKYQKFTYLLIYQKNHKKQTNYDREVQFVAFLREDLKFSNKEKIF